MPVTLFRFIAVLGPLFAAAACAARAPGQVTAPTSIAAASLPASVPAVDRRAATATNGVRAAAANCGAAFFCTDFEDQVAGAPLGAPWVLAIRHGSVEVDTTRASSGKQSVHARTFASDDRTRRAMFGIEDAPHFAPPRKRVFGRMMLWLATPPTSNAHFSIIEGLGPSQRLQGSTVRSRYGGQFKKMMANWDTDRSQGFFTDCAKRAPDVELPIGRWVCVEWRFDARENEMNLWLDGKPIDILTVKGRGDVCLGHMLDDNWYLPDYRAMRIGWQNFQTLDPVDLWLDDVAFGDGRIGCPAGG